MAVVKCEGCDQHYCSTCDEISECQECNRCYCTDCMTGEVEHPCYAEQQEKDADVAAEPDERDPRAYRPGMERGGGET